MYMLHFFEAIAVYGVERLTAEFRAGAIRDVFG
jgi:hypothetical protein